MTIERAIEILDPEHRENYDSLETVNEACRMGMAALEKIKDGRLSEVVHCRECERFKPSEDGIYYCYRDKLGNGVFMKNDDFCSYGVRKEEVLSCELET